MNTQIYMLCIKAATADWEGVGQNKVGAAKVMAKIKKAISSGDFILGDSLDVPFLKFIRIQSIQNEIKFPGVTIQQALGSNDKWVKEDIGKEATAYGKVRKANNNENTTTFRSHASSSHFGGYYSLAKEAYVAPEFEEGTGKFKKGWKTTGAVLSAAARSGLKRNKFADVEKPDHSDFVFTKYADNATPQFAFAASAQEPIWLSVFFFRRRIGAGIAGVRMPFLMIGLYKSLINSWSLDSDMNETVSMSYSSIAWASIPPFADTNAPGWVPAMRWWDTEGYGGGNIGGWSLIMTGLTAILTGVMGGLVKGAEVISNAAAGDGTNPFGNV